MQGATKSALLARRLIADDLGFYVRHDTSVRQRGNPGR